MAIATAHAKTDSPTSGGLRLTIWRSVDDIDVDAWNAVRGDGDIFMDIRFLRAVEASMAPQTGFWYLLFTDAQNRPAAISCLSSYVIDGTLLIPEGPLKWSVKVLGRVMRQAVYYRVLFCGIPLSAGQSHLRICPSADTPAVIALLTATMDSIARSERAAVIVMKEFRDDERPAVDQVEAYGFRRADSPPMNMFPPQWDSFDEFLNSLTSKQRWNFRHSIKKIDRNNIRVVRPDSASEVERLMTPEVHQLYEQVFNRSDTKVEYMPVEFFRRLAVELPENSRYVFLMDGETVLGFGVSICDDKSYRPLLAGIDYSRNAEADLYFNVIYETLSDALDHHVQEIHMGANADSFKQSRLGCVPDRRSVYVKGVRTVISWILRHFFDLLFPPIDVGDARH